MIRGSLCRSKLSDLRRAKLKKNEEYQYNFRFQCYYYVVERCVWKWKQFIKKKND